MRDNIQTDLPPAPKEIRLLSLHSKWLKGTASQTDIKELLANGKLTQKDVCAKKPKAKGRPARDFPQFVAGMDALGAVLMRRFPGIGIQIGRQVIQNWRKLEHVPDGCIVPFPAPRASNRYAVADCIAWIERYFPEGGPAAGMTEKQRTKDQIEERKLTLLNLEVAKAEGRVIDRESARATRIASMTIQNNIVRSRVERACPQLRVDWLKQLGVVPELIAEFQRRDIELAQKTIDGIYEAYAAESRKEPEQRLSEEMKAKTVKI
jgi:hypothetical protein